MPVSAFDGAMKDHFKPYEFDQNKYNFPPEPVTEKAITQLADQFIDQTLDQQVVSQFPSITTGHVYESTVGHESTKWVWDQQTVDAGVSELPTVTNTITTFFENATSGISQQLTTSTEDNFIVAQESGATNSTVLNATIGIDEFIGNSSITEIIDTSTENESHVTDIITYVNHTMRDIGNNTDSSTDDQTHVQSAVMIMCIVVGLLLALILVGSLIYFFNKSKLSCGESKLTFFQQRESDRVQNNETIILADSSRPVQDSSYTNSRL